MNVLALFCLLCIVIALSVNGQFDDNNEDFNMEQEQEQDQSQQTLTLTRESLEALLQMLSPTCRTEMEGAIGNNGDISNECRRDIQEGLVSLNIAPSPNGREPPRDASSERRREEKPRRTEAVPPSEDSGRQAVFAIVGLVVLFFGIAVAYVIYYNKAHGTGESKKPKKLSKKKVII